MLTVFALGCLVASFVGGFAGGRRLRNHYLPANLIYLALLVAIWFTPLTGLLWNCIFMFASALFISIAAWEQVYAPSARNHMKHFPTVLAAVGVFLIAGSQAHELGLIPPTHSDPFELLGGALLIGALGATVIGWWSSIYESPYVNPALLPEELQPKKHDVVRKQG